MSIMSGSGKECLTLNSFKQRKSTHTRLTEHKLCIQNIQEQKGFLRNIKTLRETPMRIDNSAVLH